MNDRPFLLAAGFAAIALLAAAAIPLTTRATDDEIHISASLARGPITGLRGRFAEADERIAKSDGRK